MVHKQMGSMTSSSGCVMAVAVQARMTLIDLLTATPLDEFLGMNELRQHRGDGIEYEHTADAEDEAGRPRSTAASCRPTIRNR